MSIDYTKRVQVFYNLHKHTFSVRQGGKVVAHADSLNMTHVRFLVQPAGRAKVLREKVKNVHAFVTGYIRPEPVPVPTCSVPVTYNPFKYATFVQRENEQPVRSAAYAQLRNDVKPTILARYVM